MREIKFRAWDGTKMYNPIIADGKIFRSGRDYEDYNDAPFDSLMQYTGLKDKNGVEIYEGDILKNDDNDYERAVVRWDSKCASFVFDMYYDGDSEVCESCGIDEWTSIDHFKVISNIHQTKEESPWNTQS